MLNLTRAEAALPPRAATPPAAAISRRPAAAPVLRRVFRGWYDAGVDASSAVLDGVRAQ